MRQPLITVADEDTFRIYAPGADVFDGGLGPDSLVVGQGRALVGPISKDPHERDVYYLPSCDEAGWMVFAGPVNNAANVMPAEDPDGPMGGLDSAPASQQLNALRAGFAAVLSYTRRVPCLDERLKQAALEDLPRSADEATAVDRVAEPYLGKSIPLVLPNDEPVRPPAANLSDAVERITGECPSNQMQVRTLLRRWGVLRATAGVVTGTPCRAGDDTSGQEA